MIIKNYYIYLILVIILFSIYILNNNSIIKEYYKNSSISLNRVSSLIDISDKDSKFPDRLNINLDKNLNKSYNIVDCKNTECNINEEDWSWSDCIPSCGENREKIGNKIGYKSIITNCENKKCTGNENDCEWSNWIDDSQSNKQYKLSTNKCGNKHFKIYR